MSSASAAKSAQRASVVAPRRSRGADRLGRRRRRHADAEREDAGRRVPVLADHAPADRVAGPSQRETGATTTCPPSVVLAVPDSTVPSGASTWIAPRRDRHRLVEAQPDLGRGRLDARLRRGLGALEDDVPERRARDEERERRCRRGARASRPAAQPVAAEDRRRIAVREEEHGQQHERQREPRRQTT